MHTDATQQQIRERAFAIWEAAGCPDGTDIAIWLQAEAEVLEAAAKVRKPAAKKAPAKKAAAPRKTAAKTTAAKKAPAKKPAAKKPAAKKPAAPKA